MQQHHSNTHEKFSAEGDLAESSDFQEDHWSADEIEQVYQRAMQALDHVELQAEDLQAEFEHYNRAEESASKTSEKTDGPIQANPTDDSAENPDSRQQRITPKQIIEAALFVGGTSLTIKKLCSLLRDDFSEDYVELTIQRLNELYSLQNRPYEIQFGEGGYRLVLRQNLDRIREQVFGLGPKEIKLSQEALEMLALIAYKQPVTVKEIESLGKQKPGGLLRQLVRRELVALNRDESDRSNVTYTTTDRFLEVFGLTDLDELPQTDDLSFK